MWPARAPRVLIDYLSPIWLFNYDGVRTYNPLIAKSYAGGQRSRINPRRAYTAQDSIRANIDRD